MNNILICFQHLLNRNESIAMESYTKHTVEKFNTYNVKIWAKGKPMLQYNDAI
jgi:hypothetical protein